MSRKFLFSDSHDFFSISELYETIRNEELGIRNEGVGKADEIKSKGIFMKDNIVYEKSKIFALNIIKIYKLLNEEKKENVLSKQMLRSGTSIGANITEAVSAISRKEFLSKMYIAFKECNEALYWLELLHQSQYLNEEEYNSIYEECYELKKMLSSITKTVRESENKHY